MVSLDARWVFQRFLEAFPNDAPASVVGWCEQNCRVIGSARSDTYRSSITPWTRDPLECANIPTVRRMTFVKPVQCGGSTVGELAIEYWISHFTGGDIQYNWPNDLVAASRWKKHMEKKLLACAPVVSKLSSNRFDWTDGLVVFPHLNFILQGINTERSVASDSIRAQVNEELHDVDNWVPGRLKQAYGRCTAYWNSIIFNISNAGRTGSELHVAYEAGTKQRWEVKCPGCGQYHVMRTRWDDKAPQLGGLRYTVPEKKEAGGDINYPALIPTIRYQMPCGYTVREDVSERRALSLSGRYPEPPPNAPERSYTLEAVSVDYIPWLDLITEKHQALRARKLGDPKPWLDYLRERECQFIGLSDRKPEAMPIILTTRKKDRAGLPNKRFRFAQLDYQAGRKDLGETPHWWLVIQDFDGIGSSLIVWEGKCDNEGEVTDVLRRHSVAPICTAVDASFTAEDRYVYFFCLKYGFNAIKVHGRRDGDRTFTHEDGVKRAWSEPEPLWPRASSQQGPTKEDPNLEPEFWNISQAGAMDALAHLMARKQQEGPERGRPFYQIPSDVSEDFKLHFAAWSLSDYRVALTNQLEYRWKKSSEKAPDHLYMCCTYLALWAEMAGATGVEDITAETKPEPLGEVAAPTE